MKWKKYMMFEGLVFLEEKDMKRFSDMVCKGWVFDLFVFMGYKFRKVELQNLIYSLDYCVVNDDSMDEYFDIFENVGWEYVCFEYIIYIFVVVFGMKLIYFDCLILIDKYK